MRRSAFAPDPFPDTGAATSAHPPLLFVSFCALSVAIGQARTPADLALAAAGTALFLVWPDAGFKPLRALLGFAPLLLLVPPMHALRWRGFGGGSPWLWDGARLGAGLIAAARLALWILISARVIARLHPAALLARLPADARLARRLLTPMLTLSCLGLTIREAFQLERAWRARGGLRGRRFRVAHWPSLILPLFRNLLARGDTLADSLRIRSFPDRWAGRPAAPPGAGDVLPALLAALLLVWLRVRGG